MFKGPIKVWKLKEQLAKSIQYPVIRLLELVSLKIVYLEFVVLKITNAIQNDE